MTAAEPATQDWASRQRQAGIIGCVGLALCALGWLINTEQFFRSFLLALLFWLAIALGSLALLMVQHLSGGAWGLLLRRVLEAATRTLPLLALLFIPLAFGLHHLYEWARPEIVAEDPLLQHKAPYLNIPGYLGRFVAYFVIWIVLAFLLNRWSREQDQTSDPQLLRRFRLLSGPGLALYGVTITFASIDWVMSLEPHWFSSIYGVLFGMGQVLSAYAFALAVLLLLADYPPLSERLNAAILRDLGNLLLAFVMLWAYLSFSQFLLIWSANLPEEIPWYLRRLSGGWQYLGLALALFHFGLPFLLLLSRDIKHDRRKLSAVALGVLGMRFVDLYWVMMPAFHPEYFVLHWLWLDAAALAGVGGVWLAVFLGQLQRRPLLPVGDPY